MQAEPMGDFIFLLVPDYTDVLELSLTPFPWPESLQRVLSPRGPLGTHGLLVLSWLSHWRSRCGRQLRTHV